VIPQAASIVDFAWYPRATVQDPASFCFVASVRECPVRLLDAADGRLRASYRIVDHRERHIAPHCLAFNGAADKLYCGFEDAVEVFDLGVPGEGTRMPTTPSRKSKDGLKGAQPHASLSGSFILPAILGIISSLAFCPSYDPSYSYFAAGSLSPSSAASSNIALYSEDSGTKAVGWIGDVRAGVVQLAFNPAKPHILYSSFRRHDTIYAWDLRGDTSTTYQTFKDNEGAKRKTNQKTRFDVDLGGKLLAVGNESGEVSVFNLDEAAQGTEAIDPTLRYHAHEDAVGSVSYHPLQPALLSVSGSRHFITPDDADRESSGSDVEDSPVPRPLKRQPVVHDASAKLWGFD